MTNLKQLKKEILILGYYQLAGGIIGIGIPIFLTIEIFNQITEEGIPLLLMILIYLPFVFSIYAGYQCINDKQNKLLVSKINQVLQIISFNIIGYAFTYHSGIYFSIGFDTTEELMFSFKFGISNIFISLHGQSESSIVLINVIAIFLLSRIMKYENLIEDKEEEIMNDGQYLDEHMMTND